MGEEYNILYTTDIIAVTSKGRYDLRSIEGRKAYQIFLKMMEEEDNPNLAISREKIKKEAFENIKLPTMDNETGVATAKGSMPGNIQDQHLKGADTHAGVENVVMIHDKKKQKHFGN